MHPDITRAGDTNKNIIVYFGTRTHQNRSNGAMSRRVSDMERDGYIVYKFYWEDRGNKDIDQFFRNSNVYMIPTILIFDRARVVGRHVGMCAPVDIIHGVKLRDEQNDT